MLKPEDESGRRFRVEFRDWLEQNLNQDIHFLTFRPPPPIAMVSRVGGKNPDRAALAAYPTWHGSHADPALIFIEERRLRNCCRGGKGVRSVSRRNRIYV